jgi:hypothetical protein
MLIADAISVAVILAEVNPVSLYFCRKVKESFGLCKSHTKLHFLGLKCLAHSVHGEQDVIPHHHC